LIRSLQDMGFTAKEAISIISSPALSKASRFGDHSGNSEVYDVRDTPEEHFVAWWNDLEKDSRYKEWTTDMGEVKKRISLLNRDV
jgi:UDP-glucose:glycoprotein glucosyltransferase